MKKLVSTIFLFVFCMSTSGIAQAIEPEELAAYYSTPETITTQTLSNDDVISPYQVTGESLVGLVQKMGDFDIPGSKVMFNRKTAQLFVRNTPTNQESVESILGSLRDSMSRQIEIEARIVQINTTDVNDLGLDFLDFSADGTRHGRRFGTNTDPTLGGSGINFPNVVGTTPSGDTAMRGTGGQFAFSVLGDHFSMDSYLDALASHMVVNTLASPYLIVSNNQRANITISEAQYYVQSVDSDLVDSDVALDPTVGIAEEGTILDVTPTINNDGTITVELHPQFASVDLTNVQQINMGPGIPSGSQPFVTLPIYNIQSADTTVTIDNGGVAVIAGLIEERETKALQKVPVLGDIPVIGKFLFSSETTKQEKWHLVIFIKTTIKNTTEPFIS